MLLMLGECRGVSRDQDGGVAEVVCKHLWWLCVQKLAQYPDFLPNPSFCSRLFTSGSWVFFCCRCCSLCMFVWNWPQLHMQKIILGAHAISLPFFAGGDMCPCASIAAKGLRSQTVS